MDDFDDSDLGALFAHVDQLEATRHVPTAQNKVCARARQIKYLLLVPQTGLQA